MNGSNLQTQMIYKLENILDDIKSMIRGAQNRNWNESGDESLTVLYTLPMFADKEIPVYLCIGCNNDFEYGSQPGFTFYISVEGNKYGKRDFTIDIENIKDIEEIQYNINYLSNKLLEYVELLIC